LIFNTRTESEIGSIRGTETGGTWRIETGGIRGVGGTGGTETGGTKGINGTGGTSGIGKNILRKTGEK